MSILPCFSPNTLLMNKPTTEKKARASSRLPPSQLVQKEGRFSGRLPSSQSTERETTDRYHLSSCQPSEKDKEWTLSPACSEDYYLLLLSLCVNLTGPLRGHLSCRRNLSSFNHPDHSIPCIRHALLCADSSPRSLTLVRRSSSPMDNTSLG